MCAWIPAICIEACTYQLPHLYLQAAKSLGQTLRAFQPTIREVVEVSNEIKGTLEQVTARLVLQHSSAGLASDWSAECFDCSRTLQISKQSAVILLRYSLHTPQ